MKTLQLRPKRKVREGDEAAELERFLAQEEEIMMQMEKLQEMIYDAPERIRREYENRRSLMPAPDDWEDRVRERKLRRQLSRGQLRNERRYQARCALLLVVCASASGAILAWIWSFLHAHAAM